MLDAFIIDAIRRAEIERLREEELRRVRLELPIDRPRDERPRPPQPAHEMGDEVVIPVIEESIDHAA